MMGEEPVKWECAVCGSPMKVKGQCEVCAPEEFQPEYFWAFMTLAVHLYTLATGHDSIRIPLKLLKKFDPNDCPDVIWDPVEKAWVMRNKAIEEKSQIIVAGHSLLNKN